MRPVLALALLLPLAASAQTLPTLSDAFGRGIPGAGGVARGTDLFRVTVPRERYADAVCADGTPAVFFVRRASDAAHRDDWVLYLQGGGSCDSGQDCHERWLGRDGNFGANKLSSRFAPRDGIASGGIESRSAENPFAAWNHVFLYYCSSDGWAGTARDVATAANHDGAPVAYRVNFLGARIVDAVVDMLRTGTAYTDAAGAAQRMPDLDGAATVLFGGSSAGGSGVRTNADRVGALLAPGTRYAAVIDASYGLGAETLDHTNSRACGPALAGSCTYETSMRYRWFHVLLDFRHGVADASCVAYHAPAGDEWRCADGVHVLQHHVATPFFVRADLQDRLVMGNTLEAGYTLDGVPLDRALYGMLEEIQLRELATLAQRSEEGIAGTPGVFGPQCGDHETLRSNEPTFNRAIVAGGTPYRMLDVLANWLAGRAPSRVVETFDAAGPPRGCGLSRPRR